MNAIITFLKLMTELVVLFIGISFFVSLLQVYVSRERVHQILSTPRAGVNSVLGALLGAVTPFCSCSTIPVLIGLFRSGAPFCGAISFLLTSPILNPAILTLMVAFFGLKAAVIYALFTFSFAVIMGLLLDAAGFESQVKDLTPSGGCCCCSGQPRTWEYLEGTFWQKQVQSIRIALNDAGALFKSVLPYLLLGAGIGAFIHDFIPMELIARFVGAENLWAVPAASIVGIPMYIRTETMIPIASVLMDKGVSPGVMIALILGGAGASIPEVSLLTSIFKRKLIIVFLLSVFAVASITGYIFNWAL